MQNRLHVNVEKRNGSRIRTISLKETESQFNSSMAAVTPIPYKGKENETWLKNLNVSLAQKNNLRLQNKSNLTCIANQEISEFPEI